jgi:hypothetical protein
MLLVLAVIGLAPATASAQEKEEGFRPLFNGKDTAGWHLRDPQGHNSWSVEDGVLKNTVSEGVTGR